MECLEHVSAPSGHTFDHRLDLSIKLKRPNLLLLIFVSETLKDA